MVAAGEVAKYIIKSLPVDNLKLQKLLYYSQAVRLVLNSGAPLFPEPIEAWDYGPVVPSVYHEYKSYGLETITIPALWDTDTANLIAEDIVFIDMALAYFGEMSGLALMSSAHQEEPWKISYRPGRPSNIIPIDLIYNYFKNTLEFEDG
jgi:uncharacterized phage-associated protein